MKNIFRRMLDISVSIMIIPVMVGWLSIIVIRTEKALPHWTELLTGNVSFEGKTAVVIGCVGVVISILVFIMSIYWYIKQYPGFMWFFPKDKE